MTDQIKDILKCPVHGEPLIRRTWGQSKETIFCGSWFECPVNRCDYSLLVPSEKLNALLNLQKEVTT